MYVCMYMCLVFDRGEGVIHTKMSKSTDNHTLNPTAKNKGPFPLILIDDQSH